MSFLPSSFRFLAQSLAIIALHLVFVPAQAATIIKTDNNLNLDQTTSWNQLSAGPPVVHRAPNENDIAQWTSGVATAVNTTSTLGSDRTWLGISIVAPAAAVTLNGNTLTLGMGGIDMSTAAVDLTINSNLRSLNYTRQVWNVGTGRTLTLNTGAFTRATGSNINIQGAGNVNIGATSTGIANNASGIVGPWLTIGTAGSTRYVMRDGTTNNLAAFTTANSAISTIGATPNSNFEANAAGSFAAGASFNTLRFSSGTASAITGNATANGIMNAGTNSLTFSGNLTPGSTNELMFDAANNSITVSGIISDGAAPSAITKTGTSSLTLSNDNTYTGDTHVNLGTLIITHNNALGTTAGVTYINGGDTASGGNPSVAGGQVRLDGASAPGGSLTLSENFIVFGRGNGQNPNAFLNNTGNNTLTGLYTLSGTGGASRVNVATGTRLTMTGGVAVTPDQAGLFVLNPQGTGVLSFTTNPIILKSNGQFYFDSGGTVELGTTNNVWGTTMLVSGTLKMMATNALPTAANISMGANYGSNNETLDLNGFSQDTGPLTNTTNHPTNPVNRQITNSSSTTTATLTLNQTTNGTYQGFTSGNLSIVKKGSAGITLTLNSTGTHTGDTRVEAGTLALANINALSASTLDTHTSGLQAVTFTVTGTNTYNLGGLKGTDDLAINDDSISVGANNQSTTYAGIISGTGGGLTKVGTGTLRLTNASTYTGGTTVTNGTLLANNASGTSATGTGAITVQTGGTLGGNGFISTLAGLTVQSGGTLAPGDGPDRLTITASINLNAGAIFNTQIAIGGIAAEGNGTTGTSLLDANGTVTITDSLLTGTWGGTSANLFSGGTLTADQRFWLIDNDNTDVIGGMFANANILGDASIQAMFGGSASAFTTTLGGQQFAVFYNADITTNALTGGNDLLLVAIVPEPAKTTLLLLSILGLTLRRHRARK